MNRVITSLVVPIVALSSLNLAREADARAGAGKPKVWAIVVGIDRYEDDLIPRCQGAVRDARVVADWFASKAGWSRQNVLRMDDFGQKLHGPAGGELSDLLPTRDNLDWAVVEWLGHRVQQDDIVVIYFAGQANARKPRPGATLGRSYLLPIDARGIDPDATGWSLDDALDRAKAVAAKKARVVIWLDTSPFGRGQRGLAVDKGAPNGQDWLRALTRWPGVTAWLAADGGLASEAGSPGPFVSALLTALGTSDQAHNLLGCLKRLRDDPEVVKRGFRTMGGVGPVVSLWSGGANVVEEAVPELIVQAGHGDRVTSVLVTADNAHAITSSHDSTVRVWGLADRSLVRTLTDPIVGVEALALDRDGAVLIAGDGVGRLIGWDMTLDRPKPYYGPAEHAEGIVDLTFLPEGKTFVSRDRARRSILWDAGRGVIKKLRVFSNEPLSRLASAARPGPKAAALASAVEPGNGDPGWLLTFDASANPIARHLGPGGRIGAIDLSDDGRRLVSGDDKGRVVVLDLPGGDLAYSGHFQGPIRLVRFSKAGLLLISDDRSLHLVEPRAGARPIALADAQGAPLPGEVDRSAFSDDGRWLAACTSVEGRTHLWQLADPARPRPVALPRDDSQGLSPAFSPDGRTLLVGDADGGLRSWDIEDGPGGLKAEARPKIQPARGKVAGLAPSASGRYLLEITRDDLGLVWDLQEGRGCKPLPGSWSSGGFLPDESRLLLATRPDQGGDIVLFDRAKGEALPVKFERPVGPDGRPTLASFSSLVVSKSGRWVAASSLEANRPLACVWRVEDGKLVHVARDHDGGLTAIDLSADEQYLLTASEDGAAKLWPLADPEVELHRAAMTFFNPASNSPAITAARFSPANSGRVVTGTRGGYVFLWEWEKGRRNPPVDLGQLEGEVNASIFSPDGRWVVASGALNKSIRFWSIAEAGPPRLVRFSPQPHHGEQVGALAAWPNGSMIVSGGDDAALRFWDLRDHALIGTLVAQGRDDRLVDWLAFTPEGLFDGSMPGEAMVKWRVGDRIVTLQQSEDTHHVFQLAGAFGRGEKPRIAELKDEGPRLKIDSPATDRTVDAREIDLTIWSGDTAPSALRLYQNGVPVKGECDFVRGAGPNFLTTRVALRKGLNRFYAMASKPSAIDGQSNEVTLRYDGPEPPGRVHTLAIGISGYKKRPLKYAHLDARRIAEFLQGQGIAGLKGPGEQIVLVDDKVTPESINDAFRTLRDAVKGKPEDTVVLFLAGHTDTDTRSDQFCLLLPEFSFQAAPAPGAELALANPGVAIRGNAGAGSFRIKVGDPDVMPYVVLYNRLARLEALQRLIIVDACQAGAILQDPAVRNIQRLVEVGSRKARNSYLLAARRGEPANEADALEHGLLTYTLLHGLRAPGLKVIPADLGGFPGRPSADMNQDGLVTSDELVAYADDALPRLAQMFPQVVMRAGNPLPPPPGAGAPDLEKKLKVQASEASFPLIALPPTSK
jgi:WD40 repeat protein/uncharacterized caspase-like protein